MTILGTSTGVGQGFVGIGLPNPAFRLDVADHINVNIAQVDGAYKIDANTVLHAWPDKCACIL